MMGILIARFSLKMSSECRHRGELDLHATTCTLTPYKVGNCRYYTTTWGAIRRIVQNWVYKDTIRDYYVIGEKEVVTGGKPEDLEAIKKDWRQPVSSRNISNNQCTQLTAMGRLCQHNLLDFLKKLSRPAKITMLEDRRKQQLTTSQGVSRQIAAIVLSVCASYLSHTTLIQKSINVCRQAQGFMFELSARWATCGLINMQNGGGISC